MRRRSILVLLPISCSLLITFSLFLFFAQPVDRSEIVNPRFIPSSLQFTPSWLGGESTSTGPREAAIRCYQELHAATRIEIRTQIQRQLPPLASLRYTNHDTIQFIFVLKKLDLDRILQLFQGPWYCDHDSIPAKLWMPDPHRFSFILECPSNTTTKVVFRNDTYWIQKFLHCEKTSSWVLPARTNSSNNQQIRLAMCTMVRSLDSMALVPQWIEYHRIIGFQQFWVYINDDWDLTRQPAPDMGYYFAQPEVQTYAALIPFGWYSNNMDGFYYQQAMQNDCLSLARRENISWMALTDVDEYIQIMDNSSVTMASFLAQFEKHTNLGGVSIRNWFFATRTPQVPPTAQERVRHTLFRDYQYRATDPTFFHRTKVIARPDRVIHFSVHGVTKGGPRAHLDPHGQVRLAHFKSPHLGLVVDPLDEKMSSSNSSNNNNSILTAPGVHDSSLWDYYGRALEERLNRLLRPVATKADNGHAVHMDSTERTPELFLPRNDPMDSSGNNDSSLAYIRSFSQSSLTGRALTFLHIPKTGGTTVEALIAAPANLSWGARLFDKFPFRYAGRCSPHHVPLYYWPLQGVNPYEHADVFTIVRHPIRRMLSEYYWRLNTFPFLRDSRDMTTFMKVQFIMFDRNSNLLQARCHLHPQLSFVLGFNEVRMVDHVLDLDHNIKRDFDELAKAYGLNVTWPVHERAMAGAYQTTELALIPDFVALIVHRFAQDFSLLRDKGEAKRWTNMSFS